MIGVTADFAPHDGFHIWPYQMGDNDTVGDLKDTVSGDPNTPVSGQPRANINVTDPATGNLLGDLTPLVDQATYEVDLVGAAVDGGPRDGTVAPPNSPPGGGDGDGGGAGGFGGLGPHQDGVLPWVYFAGVANGPVQYPLAAGATAAALKAAVAADQSSPLALVGASQVAVYDGTSWLEDNAPIESGAAYTVQPLP